MKKTLLSLTLALLATGASYAQCTPGLNGPSGDIEPDTLVNLDTAFVGMPYEMIIQLYVPADTLFDLGTGPTLVQIDDFTIDDVLGMPTGFTWTSNPSPAVFPGGSAGCLIITAPATAVTSTLLGVNDITVDVVAHALGGLVSLPVSVTGYNIFVQEPNGIEDLETANFAVGQNVPNPFKGESVISYNTPFPTKVELKVFDILGKTVSKQTAISESGINEFVLDATSTPAGIYFYSVNNGSKTITKRFVVAK